MNPLLGGMVAPRMGNPLLAPGTTPRGGIMAALLAAIDARGGTPEASGLGTPPAPQLLTRKQGALFPRAAAPPAGTPSLSSPDMQQQAIRAYHGADDPEERVSGLFGGLPRRGATYRYGP